MEKDKSRQGRKVDDLTFTVLYIISTNLTHVQEKRRRKRTSQDDGLSRYELVTTAP